MAEIRIDSINRHTVVIAPERSKRPKDDFNSQPILELCPFCPGNEKRTPPEIFNNARDKKKWTIRSFPNKYPAFNLVENGNISGVQEVIVESDEHDINMGDYSFSHLKEVLKTYKWHINKLKQNEDIKYIVIFKNHGFLAGATLMHQHSQIVGLCFIPDLVHQRIKQLNKYFSENSKCYYCHLLEESDIIFENESFVLISPYEVKFSYESWIIPKTHQMFYENITDDQLNDLTDIISRQLKNLNSLLDKPAFNMIINSGLYNTKKVIGCHWYVQIIPRISIPAGFEWATGMFINQVKPEEAAQQFKKLLSNY